MASDDQQELFERIRAIFVEMFDLDASQIVPQARLYEDLDIDSIDAVDLVARLKEITGTRVTPEDFKSVRTVEDVVDVTAKLLRAA
jgi:acyl carrier protein